MPRGQFDALEFEARGVGSAEPLASGDTEADKQRNRRVAVRIEPLGTAVTALTAQRRRPNPAPTQLY